MSQQVRIRIGRSEKGPQGVPFLTRKEQVEDWIGLDCRVFVLFLRCVFLLYVLYVCVG